MVTSFKDVFLPLYISKISAGFPSPADDFIEQCIDLNDVMILHPSATKIITMPNDSLLEFGIFSGDYLLHNNAIPPRHNNIVVCHNNGDLIIGRFDKKRAMIANNKITHESIITGVITWSVRRL